MKWSDVEGHSGRYEVSDDGRVRSLSRSGVRSDGRRWSVAARELSQRINSNGYPSVTLCHNGKLESVAIHVLVAATFIGPRPRGYQVAHCDGSKTNNCANNLRYDTPAGNQRDRIKHGTNMPGEQNPSAKLTRKQVELIRADSRRQIDIAADYGISQVRVS